MKNFRGTIPNRLSSSIMLAEPLTGFCYKVNRIWLFLKINIIYTDPLAYFYDSGEQFGCEKHGCHAMILPWSFHDHGETWSWSINDDSMITIFLDVIMVWVSFFHDSYHDYRMIIMFTTFHEEVDFSSSFPKIMAVIFHYMGNAWLALEELTPIICRVFRNKEKYST